MAHPTRSPAVQGIVFLLAALAALGPFSIDTYLPSFDDIATSLATTPPAVHQTLTAYLLPFALMTLWHGAISDALGRRPVILFNLAAFAAASIGCMLATSIEQLWVLRAVQGMTAGAGLVICRAIVRDLHDGPSAQRLMSRIMILFALAPVVAPMLGGWLQVWLGWRSVFAFLVVLSVALWLACWFLLPETLPVNQRQPLRAGHLLRGYRTVLGARPFLLVCAALAFNFAAFFIYVLSAPTFLMRHLGVSPTGFLWLSAPAMGGLMIGAWLSGILAGRLSPRQTVSAAYLVMAGSAALNIMLNVGGTPSLPWSVVPIFGFTVGMSLAMPSLTIQALDLFPEQRGLAASCQAFVQAACNALAAGVVAPVVLGSTTTLALGMGGLMLLGAWATLVRQRRVAPSTVCPG